MSKKKTPKRQPHHSKTFLQKRNLAARQWPYVLTDHEDLPEEERHTFVFRAPTATDWDYLSTTFTDMQKQRATMQQLAECTESFLVDSTVSGSLADDESLEPHHIIELFLQLINRSWAVPLLAKKNSKLPSPTDMANSASDATQTPAPDSSSPENSVPTSAAPPVEASESDAKTVPNAKAQDTGPSQPAHSHSPTTSGK